MSVALARSTKRASAGRRAEAAAVDYLRSNGFEILGTNVRVGALEIDVVARRGDLVAVVEVRTRGRGSFVGALESVDARKRGRLLRAAARLWREKLSTDESIARLRIDVIAVSFDDGRTLVEHIEAAIVAS
jgi:putative endonuclease